MNTIPTIFNERKVPHTVVGGNVRKTDEEETPFTVILLNRGGRYYRSAVFQNLENAGFTSIISIELSSESYDIESLSVRFPKVKFLVPLEKVSIGEMINTGMAETSSPYVFVLWNDIKISPSSITRKLMDRISKDQTLCVAPALQSQKMEALPVQMVPALLRNSFRVEAMPCLKDNSPTIYASDFTGVYNRERFVRLGGFDHTIRNPYWQNLDFGFRAYLWGEQIRVATSFRLVYDGEVPVEDVTRDSAYLWFYLKNLAPVFRKDQAVLPTITFFRYLPRAGINPLDAIGRFRAVRSWVKTNRYRFTQDAQRLSASWEPIFQ